MSTRYSELWILSGHVNWAVRRVGKNPNLAVIRLMEKAGCTADIALDAIKKGMNFCKTGGHGWVKGYRKYRTCGKCSNARSNKNHREKRRKG